LPAVVSPVMDVFGAFALTMVPDTGPLSWLQVPVPANGVLPFMVTDPAEAQMVWADPALAVVGTPITAMVTSLVLAVQGLLLMVQRNT